MNYWQIKFQILLALEQIGVNFDLLILWFNDGWFNEGWFFFHNWFFFDNWSWSCSWSCGSWSCDEWSRLNLFFDLLVIHYFIVNFFLNSLFVVVSIFGFFRIRNNAFGLLMVIIFRTNLSDSLDWFSNYWSWSRLLLLNLWLLFFFFDHLDIILDFSLFSCTEFWWSYVHLSTWILTFWLSNFGLNLIFWLIWLGHRLRFRKSCRWNNSHKFILSKPV